MKPIVTPEIQLTEHGTPGDRPVLLLHGGGGPATVLPWAERLAATRPAHVLTPTHPGWDGTPRPEETSTIAGLATAYAELLDARDLHDVTVVGNSIGGWVAAELALLGSPRTTRFVLVDAVGLEVPGQPVADFFALTPAELAQLSYADPQRYGIDPAALPPEARARMAANRPVIEDYAGRAMTDATLAGRLSGVTAPTLVVWGEADRIVTPDYGRAYAAAVPGAEFRLLPCTGHLPQVETPDLLTEAVWDFVTR
ncbi:pimeloyl-ACP methyl ester carboxylesterase [Motilibacter peucedani]|uniref:Pimeloyl-ACP methyl ester carboxylesterase n=1 Tax=Motilibacter peucedani TaxID=598650 RepID=A0A420XN02_9ACTN|nr:alpha/beta hydrolase [Motilibacter peucedani]RKS72649.1 pimeloyl-ACP methyl ester carboxylesterase [Motilibacter peucedani]